MQKGRRRRKDHNQCNNGRVMQSTKTFFQKGENFMKKTFAILIEEVKIIIVTGIFSYAPNEEELSSSCCKKKYRLTFHELNLIIIHERGKKHHEYLWCERICEMKNKTFSLHTLKFLWIMFHSPYGIIFMRAHTK